VSVASILLCILHPFPLGPPPPPPLLSDLSMRPDTPRSGLMPRKVDGNDVLQKSPQEMQLREEEVERVREWAAIMQHAADWWPSVTPSAWDLEAAETQRLRRAEKALTGTLLALLSHR
jgi:hypothetical protein